MEAGILVNTYSGETQSVAPYNPPQPQTIALPLPAYRPLWTYVLLGINIAVWLLMTAMGGSENPLVLIRFGAKYNPLIVAGQYWRLLTATFVHIGIMHLVFNAWALFNLGLEIETRFGRTRFLALYLLSGLLGSASSFLGNNALSAGASGAIFGLIGAAIAYFATYHHRFGHWGRNRLVSVLIVAGYNLVWGLTAPGIDNLGHIGGLVGGLILGWAYCPNYKAVPQDDLLNPYRVVDRGHPARAWGMSIVVTLLLLAFTVMGVQFHS